VPALVLSGCVAAGLFVAAAVLPSRIASARKLPPTINVWLLDEPWKYRPASAYSVLGTFGAVGRDIAVKLHVTLDAALPPAYGFFLANLSAWAWGTGRGSEFSVVPLLAVLADYSENTAIVLMVRQFASQPRVLAILAWWSSLAKWILILVSVALTAYRLVTRR